MISLALTVTFSGLVAYIASTGWRISEAVALTLRQMQEHAKRALEIAAAGGFWLARDLWRKGRIRRKWRLVERVLSRTDDDPQVPKAIRSMQLWR